MPYKREYNVGPNKKTQKVGTHEKPTKSKWLKPQDILTVETTKKKIALGEKDRGRRIIAIQPQA